MKKIIALLLALVMCVGMFTGCGCARNEDEIVPTKPEEETTAQQDQAEVDANLDKALEYLRVFYKDTPEKTAMDYTRIGTVRVAGVTYDIAWTVDVGEDLIKIVANEDGSYTIDINEEAIAESTEPSPYVLTATLTGTDGRQVSLTWNLVIPAAIDEEALAIVDAAYALEEGQALEGTHTLTGVIISVDTMYSEQYKNVTVTIAVKGREDKPIKCYRLKGDGADMLAVGDTITVTGTLKNYYGTIEFDAGCVLEAVESGGGTPPTAPEDPAEIVKAAYALKSGQSLPYTCKLTGKIIEVNQPYSEDYGNISVTIVVEGKRIYCYRLKGSRVQELNVNDIITVEGNLSNYQGTVEFAYGELVGLTNKNPPARRTIPAGAPVELGTGDEVVIYVPGYAKALSKSKVNTYYNKGVDVYVDEAGVMTGFGSNSTWTVTKNIDGTYSFSIGGKNLSVDPSHSNMTMGGRHDKWQVIDLGGGLYNLKNVGRRTYIEWYDEMANFSTYASSYAATDDQFQISFYVVSKGEAVAATLEEAVAGLTELYASDSNETPKDYERLGVLDLNGTLFNVVWTVEGGDGMVTVVLNDDGNYTIDITPSTSEITYTLTATVTDEAGESATLSWDYVVPAKEASDVVGTAMTTAPVNGDVIAIVNGENAMTATADGSRLAGETASIDNGVLDVTDTLAQLLVSVDENGYYTFTCGGKYLTSGATGGSLTLADAASEYSLWTVEAAADGTWYIKSVNANYNGNAQYLEYYSGFTTYGFNSSNVGIYQMQLFKVTAVFEPEDVLTVAEAIEMGKAMEHNTYTEDKYYVTGVITEVYNTTYGNMKITDGEGNILTLYGTYDADGTNRYDAMSVKPVAGDTITIYGVVGQYNGTPQIKNGWITEHIPAGGEPVEPEPPAEPTVVTIAEAIAMGAAMEHNTYTTDKYTVTGVITEVYSTVYGNMKLTDEEGNILTIYGTFNADGTVRYDAMEVKPVAGDTVTICGVVGQYNGTPQIKNGWIIAHTPAGEEPDEPVVPDEPVAPEVPEENVLTIAEAIAMGAAMEHNVYTTDKYAVTGVITEVYSTVYGNMKLTDEEGNILTIYGTFNADGTVRYDAMEVKPVAGDTVTVYGIVGQYNGTPQIKNGWIIAHTPAGEEEPDEPVVPDEPDVPVQNELSIADAIAMGAAMEHNTYTTDKYTVTGVITEVYNTQYGNMKITDEAGNILTIYGTYNADGTVRYDAMEVKPVAGDTVSIYGVIGQYNGTPQVKNGWIVAHTPAGEEEPDEPVVPDEPEVPVQNELSIADAIAMGAAMEHNTYTTDKYTVTGVITEVYNTQYGNMKLSDEAGNILTIYGTYNADGTVRYDAMEVKPVAGDTVSIYGVIGQYNGTPQVKNGWIVAYTPAESGGEEEPEEPVVPDEPSVTLTSGQYYMIASNSVPMGALDGNWILPGDAAAPAAWTVTVDGDTVKLTDPNGVTVAPKGGNNNGIKSGDYSWKLVENEDGTYSFYGQGDDTVILACNTGAENKFRAYKTATVTGYPDSYPYTFKLEKATAGEEEEEPAEGTLSIADAIAMGAAMEHNTYTTDKYSVTGVITEVYNTTYGNMKITDGAGNVLTIYGTYSADGSTRYDAMEVKPVVGDTVTIYGVIGQYNGTPQIKNGWIVAHTAAVAETVQVEEATAEATEPALAAVEEVPEAVSVEGTEPAMEPVKAEEPKAEEETAEVPAV